VLVVQHEQGPGALAAAGPVRLDHLHGAYLGEGDRDPLPAEAVGHQVTVLGAQPHPDPAQEVHGPPRRERLRAPRIQGELVKVVPPRAAVPVRDASARRVDLDGARARPWLAALPAGHIRQDKPRGARSAYRYRRRATGPAEAGYGGMTTR